MATATKQNLVAITPGGEITDEHLAGRYFWYSIPQQSLSLARVKRAFKEAGLDESILPDTRRGEHIMMEACSSVERVEQNGRRIEIHADQVDRTSDFLIYQITRHVQDKQNRVIEHPKALRVLYGFDSGKLSFEALGGATTEEVQFLIDEIQDYFDTHGTKLSGHNFRTILRHYVEGAGAENMRGQSGGVYFMLRETKLPSSSKLRDFHGDSINGAEFIAAVKTALTGIYGRAPEFHEIPCINDEGQREFLKRKFLENCSEDLKAYRDECLELVRSTQLAPEDGGRKRGFRSDKREGMIERRQDMNLRREQFAAVLGDTLGELDRDMELADKALAKFIKEAGE